MEEKFERSTELDDRVKQAWLSISFYFEDRGPVKDVEVIVPPERTRHIRTAEMDGVVIPRGVPYAVRVESSVPVIVQCSQMNTTQPALSLMTAMAHPVER